MINFKQLYYFWRVAEAGTVTLAGEQLHLTPQTISGQIGELERALGTKLFRRVGRRLELNADGRLARSYAAEIFQVGNELEAQLRNRVQPSELVFTVGVADVVPKSIAYRLLAPAMALSEPVRLVCRESRLERLFAELAVHQLDLVIADQPLSKALSVKAYNHELGRSTIAFLAAKQLATRHRRGFPASLNGAPMLVPGAGAALRTQLDAWFTKHQIRPRIVGEFDDTALMKAFGQGGSGILTVPAVIAEEVRRHYKLAVVGHADDLVATYFAISVERRLSHPAVVAISEAARRELF